ncbi:MAG TPA: mechanosensitive ion channel domain-containing protein [Candidatus Binatia bacterium]
MLSFVRWQYVLVAIMLSATIARPQDSAETGTQSPSVQTPVPLADVLTESESVSASLRDIRADLSADRTATVIAERLSGLTREIDTRLPESRKVLAQYPSVEVLGSLEGEWRRLRRELSAINRSLSARVDELDRQVQQLDDLAKTWEQTLTAASQASAPTEVLDRLKKLLEEIRGLRATVQGQRARALTLQSRVSVQDGRVTNVLESIEQARQNILSSIFLRDSAPVWDLGWPSSNAERLKQDSMTSVARQSEALTAYTVKQGPKLLITIALFSVFAAAFYWARRRYQVLPNENASSPVLNTPIAAAFVLTFLFSGWTLPQPPRLLAAILGALALVPSVLIVRPLMRNEFRSVPYALLACFILDQTRSITAAVEFLPRAVFLAEMLLVAGLAGWFIRCGGTPQRAKKLKIASYFALVISLIAIVASTAGYTNLATLLGNALVRSGYLALILYALLEVLHALVKIALHVRPFDSLAAVRRHRELLARQIRRGLRLIAILFWIFALLSQLLVAERIFRSARDFLSAEISFGSIHISAGDVLAFIVTLWAAFAVSRFVRFLLDEEVYPRLALKRGLPYAISATLHYLILFGGFFVALAALGVDMTRVTIIAGAFSVGVGLGLQNIFNNFISGLILLFERPISVGDIVEIEDASGVVERIGVRASIIRMANGSEIIMPNGKLISDRVINWTLSTRQHGIELPVAVAQGTDPGRVINLLEKTATAHPLVTSEPPPQALFVKLGPDSYGFELRAWTDRSELWMQIRSELAIAISATLAAEKIPIR